MEIKELVEKVRSEWEEIFIQEEENIRNIFLSNLDVSISMGIGLEVISVEGTDYLAGKLNLICEGEDEKPISWADTGINENMFEGMADFMSENFTDWAENGAENGTLLFPEEIANIIKQEGDMEFYGLVTGFQCDQCEFGNVNFYNEVSLAGSNMYGQVVFHDNDIEIY